MALAISNNRASKNSNVVMNALMEFFPVSQAKNPNNLQAKVLWNQTEQISSEPSELNKKAPPLKLTPLHVALLAEKTDETVQSLLNKGASPTDQTNNGWTAYHLAALMPRSKERLQILFSHSKQSREEILVYKDRMKRTYQDLCNLSETREIPVKGPVFTYLENGKMESGNAEMLKKMTGVEYLPLPIPNRSEANLIAIESWILGEKEKDQQASFRRQLLSLNPQLEEAALQRAEQTFLCLDKDLVAGWNVKAARFIPKGTLLCIYSGVISRQQESGSKYVFNLYPKSLQIDGKAQGNLARFINHSFPNAGFELLENPKTGELLPVLAALEDIEKGKSIVYDYGHQYTHWRKHKELNPEGLISFMKTKPFAPQEKEEERIYKSLYILNTPGVLYFLEGSNQLDHEELLSFLSSKNRSPYFQNFFEKKNHFELFSHTLELCKKISKIKETLPIAVKVELNNWIKQISEHHALDSIINILFNLITQIETTKTKEEADQMIFFFNCHLKIEDLILKRADTKNQTEKKEIDSPKQLKEQVQMILGSIKTKKEKQIVVKNILTINEGAPENIFPKKLFLEILKEVS